MSEETKPFTIRIRSKNANGSFVAVELDTEGHRLFTRRLSDGGTEGFCTCGDWDADSASEFLLRRAFEGHVKKANDE